MSLIVSLTSTSARLTVLRHTLISLVEQNHKPDRIVLCISKEPYLIDEGINALPEWLHAMIERDEVELSWVKNIGPYRKLIPVYQQASDDDWIVTCDDDVIYGPNWLSSLVLSGQEYPSAIVCGRARRPAVNPWGRRQSYLNWQLVPPGSRGTELLPTGVAGVLYRKPLLDRGIMSSDDFMELAPKQDDLWFHLARQRAGVEVVVSQEAGEHIYPIEAPGALSATNASSEVSSWDNLFSALIDRLMLKFRAYIGMSVCDNDIVIERLKRYRGTARVHITKDSLNSAE